MNILKNITKILKWIFFKHEIPNLDFKNLSLNVSQFY